MATKSTYGNTGVPVVQVGQSATPAQMAAMGWTTNPDTGQSISSSGQPTSVADPSWKNAGPINPNAPSGHSADFLSKNPQFNKTASELSNAPKNAVINPPNLQNDMVNYDAQTGKQLAIGASTTLPGGQVVKQGSPFKEAFQKTISTGTPAPQDMGKATGTVKGTVVEPQVSPLSNIVETDTAFDNIFKQYDDFYSPIKQKQSLLEEYKSMESALGIGAMNAELLNSKRIIEGTEDDIRSEVQAVSGFATDSQVMALANARNKSLMRNYNYLLESRDSAMTQLNTMMNLSIQDRQMAEQEFDRKMNFAFKVQEFKQKAVSNAQESYYNQIKLGGADGFYNSLVALGDPSAISVVEKTLGFTPGGLKTAALQAQKDRANQATMDALDISNKSLQNQKLRQDINQGPSISTQVVDVGNKKVLINSKTGETIKELTPISSTNATSVINSTTGKVDPRSQIANVIKNSGAKTDDKLKLTGAVISGIQDFATNNPKGSFAGLGLGQVVPGMLASGNQQKNRTDLSSLKGTVESWMTGASVAEAQQKRIDRDMIPKNGDSDKQVRNKLNALVNYMMSYTSGSLASQGIDFSPSYIDLWAPVILPNPSGGEDIEIIN